MTDRDPRPERSGFAAAVVACSVLGVAAAGGTMYFGRAESAEASRGAPAIATEEYGRQLIASTALLLGPDHPDPERRYSGSRLNCGSCHIATGTEPGTLTLLQVTEHYPRFSGRVGGMTDMVVDGETGVLVEPGDMEGLAAGIASVLRDPERAAAMGRAGQELRRREFTMEHMIGLIEDLYEELHAAEAGAGST